MRSALVLSSESSLMPHDYSFFWQQDWLWLHAMSDLAIAIIYYTVPLLLLWLWHKHREEPCPALTPLFGTFVFACGTTHILSIWTLWHPASWLLVPAKVFTGTVSLFTAGALMPKLPLFVTMRPLAELDQINETLRLQLQKQQQVEDTLHVTEEKFQRVFQHAPIGKAIVSLEGTFVQVNQAFCDLVGYSQEEMTALTIHAVTYPEDRNLDVEKIHCLIADLEQQYELEKRCCHKNGSVLWIHKTVTLLHDKDDKPDCFVVQVQDITASRAHKESLQADHERNVAQIIEQDRLSRIKDDFLSTVSHELRTPVSNMKMATHMLQLTLGDLTAPLNQEKIGRYLGILRMECEREISLINDLLDLQRLITGNQPQEPEEINLASLLPTIVDSFSCRASDRQQTLTLKLSQVAIPLRTDPRGFERIITELLNNACKYSPPGESITVGIYNLLGTLHVAITNTGIEISAHELSHIFDKFYRIPSGDPWKQGGTGLGLTLIQKLAGHLGGAITVRSGSGQTTFDLTLPLEGST